MVQGNFRPIEYSGLDGSNGCDRTTITAFRYFVQMKKQLTLMSMIALTLSLSSCSSDGTYEDSFYIRAWEENILDGNRALQRKEFAEAVRNMESAVLEARAMSHPDMRLALALDELGTAYLAMDELDKAKSTLKESLSIYERVKPPTTEVATVVEDGMARTCGNLAQILFQLKAYDEAERLFTRALSIYEQQQKVYGANALNQREELKLLVDLGDVNLQRNQLSIAEPFYARALKLLPETVGVRGYERRLLTNYRKILKFQSKDDKYLDAYMSPLDVSLETALNTDWVVARGYFINKDYERAEEVYLNALQKAEILGEVSPELIQTLAALSKVYIFQGNFEKATTCLNRAVLLQKRIIGPEDVGMHRLLKSVAMLHIEAKDYPAALETLQRQWEVDLKLPDPKTVDHCKLQNRAKLAFVLHKLGREDECDKVMAEARELLARTGRAIVPLFELGSIYVDRGNFEEARPMYAKLMKNARRKQDQYPGRLAKTLSAMAILYSKEGKFEEAAPLYREALETMRKSPVMMRTSDYFQLLHDASQCFAHLPGHEDEARRFANESRPEGALPGIDDTEEADDAAESLETKAQRRARRRAANQ